MTLKDSNSNIGPDDEHDLDSWLAQWKEQREQHTYQSALKAKNPEAARELLVKIYKWSATQTGNGRNAGQWFDDLEYFAYYVARRPGGAPDPLWVLAQRAGGWWRFVRGAGVTFVPLDEWRPIYKAWRRLEKAQKRYFKAQSTFWQLVKEDNE